LGISALFAGCETFAHFEHRAPTNDLKRVEIFRTNTQPPTNIHELGVITEEGTLQKRGEIEAGFLRKARSSGADALLFDPIFKTGEEVSLFSMADKYQFKATMVAYDKKEK
jgi:hypothetical protein